MFTRRKRAVFGVVAAFLVLGMAALLGVTGCGEKEEAAAPSEFDSFVSTTAAPATTQFAGAAAPPYSRESESYAETSGTPTAMLSALEAASGQKVIADAVLEIEVDQGRFEAVFEQARLIADRYGGYLVSSQAVASGEEDSLKSGTVVVRVPASSFNRALSDAGKLGKVKSQQIQTQDVTEEYVDLEARIANSEAHVKALLALLAKAKTVDEILQVQQTLTYAQQELEQLKGRMRYLEEHTSFSTLTMSIHETGVKAATTEDWGVVQAFKDALKNFVRAVNAIIRGLGVLIPVLIVLAIIGYIVYRIWRALARRSRERRSAQYQPYLAAQYAGQQYGAQQPVAQQHPPQQQPPAQPAGPSESPAPGASESPAPGSSNE